MITKPLTVNVTQLTWGALEALEAVGSAFAEHRQPKPNDVIRMICGCFEGWTIDDAREVTLLETQEIMLGLEKAMDSMAPKSTGTPSTPRSATAGRRRSKRASA